MNQQEMFGSAKWVGYSQAETIGGYVLRGNFFVDNVKKATLRVLGLGFFHCYINGKRVGEDLFLPLNSEYEPRENYPIHEKLHGFHTYVPEYDVTDMLHSGKNTIAIHFGGGWYTFKKGSEPSDFGLPKAIWRVFGENALGAFDFGSSEQDKIAPSFVYGSYLTMVERQDYSLLQEDAFDKDFIDEKWTNAVPAKPLQTEYAFSDCPTDCAVESRAFVEIKRTPDYAVFDCGKNISGLVEIRLKAKRGGQVRVEFSEAVQENGDLDEKHSHKQRMELISDGQKRVVSAYFTWFGFRYFAIYGDAEAVAVKTVHANIERVAQFISDNATLNWLSEAFVQSMLTNMHAGIPSDCPHIERRGYTGDGQLTTHAALTALNAQAFYTKWAQDIADGQDEYTGHIQYAAPYIRSGGGPGGYGCSIVEIPYQLYAHYGDKTVLEKYYPQMLRYFDFMEAHSVDGLVTSDVEGVWCLGDWCSVEAMAIPEPFVNTYFYVKSMLRTVEIATLLGKMDDVAVLQAKIQEKRQVLAAIMDENGDFYGGVQGANSFAVDIGLGDERTYANLLHRYTQLQGYDTGIFATDVLTRVLIERGDGALAAKLLCSTSENSFYAMQQAGSTTLWEYWPKSFKPVRSYNHHMFGAVTAYLYTYYLGIRFNFFKAEQPIVIEPILVDEINKLSGYRDLPQGRVSVAYEKTDKEVTFTLEIPQGQQAVFIWNKQEYLLLAGKTVRTMRL